MPRRKEEPLDVPISPPAKTLEGRNEQLTALAFDLAERRLQQGTASAQEVVHFLKMGSIKDRLEQEKLRKENLVLETRVKEMESRKSSEEMYSKALAAMRGYAGHDDPFAEESEYEDPDIR